MVDMVDFESALETMLSVKASADSELLPLEKCVGRIVSETSLARLDLPPFAKSAMDGFAITSGDSHGTYKILETIAAGDVPTKVISQGTCARIMTGAMLPQGADSVVRVENTEVVDNTMSITKPDEGTNIIDAGENVRRGDEIFSTGIVEARHIGIFAEQGIATLAVQIPPLIGVITTGSELKNPGESLPPGMIYNSNGPQLCAQIESMGGRYRYNGVVSDDPSKLEERLAKELELCDIVVLSGGVSMGEFDYVPRAVAAVGAEMLFHRVQVKPGKPILYARQGAKQIVGLPGNPVSTYIIFEVMIKPMVYRMMGVDYEPVVIKGNLSDDIRRRDTKRTEFRPVYVNAGIVEPAHYRGSSHLYALGSANALLRIDVGVAEVAKGSEVDVRPI